MVKPMNLREGVVITRGGQKRRKTVMGELTA